MARWSEFDLDGAQWVIRAERTKMRREHIVPLATQAIAILEELHQLTGDGDLVPDSVSTLHRPLITELM